MKRIEVVIRPTKLKDLLNVLDEMGIKEVNVFDVKSRGLQEAQKQYYRGQVYSSDLFAKVKIEFTHSDKEINEILDIITKTCRAGNSDDGKIFVYPLDNIRSI